MKKRVLMGVHIGARMHANCSDQGFKCFDTRSSWDRQPNHFRKFWSSLLIFPILKAAHGSFSLLCKTILMRRVHWYNASTTISCTPSYMSV